MSSASFSFPVKIRPTTIGMDLALTISINRPRIRIRTKQWTLHRKCHRPLVETSHRNQRNKLQTISVRWMWKLQNRKSVPTRPKPALKMMHGTYSTIKNRVTCHRFTPCTVLNPETITQFYDAWLEQERKPTKTNPSIVIIWNEIEFRLINKNNHISTVNADIWEWAEAEEMMNLYYKLYKYIFYVSPLSIVQHSIPTTCDQFIFFFSFLFTLILIDK